MIRIRKLHQRKGNHTLFVSRSYVCLCLNDPTTALECAENLLDLLTAVSKDELGVGAVTVLPSGHRVLANIYAADALIQLDRIAEAIKHLDPLKSITGKVELFFKNSLFLCVGFKRTHK